MGLDALLTETADGGPYGLELVEDALAIILLSAPGSAPREASVDAMIGRFAVRAGVRPGSSAEERDAALNAYVAGLFIPDALVAAIERLIAKSAGTEVARFAKITGAQTSATISTAPPPDDAVSGGQLARLRAHRVLDQKKEKSS